MHPIRRRLLRRPVRRRCRKKRVIHGPSACAVPDIVPGPRPRSSRSCPATTYSETNLSKTRLDTRTTSRAGIEVRVGAAVAWEKEKINPGEAESRWWSDRPTPRARSLPDASLIYLLTPFCLLSQSSTIAIYAAILSILAIPRRHPHFLAIWRGREAPSDRRQRSPGSAGEGEGHRGRRRSNDEALLSRAQKR